MPVAEAKSVSNWVEWYEAPFLLMVKGLIGLFKRFKAFKYSMAKILFGKKVPGLILLQECLYFYLTYR